MRPLEEDSKSEKWRGVGLERAENGSVEEQGVLY